MLQLALKSVWLLPVTLVLTVGIKLLVLYRQKSAQKKTVHVEKD